MSRDFDRNRPYRRPDYHEADYSRPIERNPKRHEGLDYEDYSRPEHTHRRPSPDYNGPRREDYRDRDSYRHNQGHDYYHNQFTEHSYRGDERRRRSYSRSSSPRHHGRGHYKDGRGASPDSYQQYSDHRRRGRRSDSPSVDYDDASRGQSSARQTSSSLHESRSTTPYQVVRTHGPQANGDSTPDGSATQFLLIKKLGEHVGEEDLFQLVSKLFKKGDAKDTQLGAGLRSTGLKSTSVPRNAGAKPGSLKRIFLVRDKMTGYSCGFGFAEYHSKEDAVGAFEKFTHESGIFPEDVEVTFAHLGIFMPAVPNMRESFTHAKSGEGGDMRLQYRLPHLYASELMVAENPPDEPKPVEAVEKKEEEREKKKRKADDTAASKSSKAPRIKLAAFTAWNKAQAELGHREREDAAAGSSEEPTDQPETSLPISPLIDWDNNCCYLCMRNLKPHTLRAHVDSSDLHRANAADADKIAAGWKKLKLKRPDVVVPTAADASAKQQQQQQQPLDRARLRRQQQSRMAPVNPNPNPNPNAPHRTSPSSPSSPPPAAAAKKSLGAKLLAKAGYVEGSGLGATGTGITAPIEVNRYAEGVGLGAVGGKLGLAHEVATQGHQERLARLARERYLALEGREEGGGRARGEEGD